MDWTSGSRLQTLNSATKYPSISTYHVLDGDGRTLLPEIGVSFADIDRVHVTEKIDGVNVRIIIVDQETYFLGSREELLYHRGDVCFDPMLDIVTHLRPLAEQVLEQRNSMPLLETRAHESVMVLYLEMYGSKRTKAWREYGSGEVGFRFFDLAWIPPHVLGWPVEHVASWRERGGQIFAPDQALEAVKALGLIQVPWIASVNGSVVPTDLAATRAWMQSLLPRTKVTTDDAAALGHAEGLVLRAVNRGRVAKLHGHRYDYTLNPPQPKEKRRLGPVQPEDDETPVLPSMGTHLYSLVPAE